MVPSIGVALKVRCLIVTFYFIRSEEVEADLLLALAYGLCSHRRAVRMYSRAVTADVRKQRR